MMKTAALELANAGFPVFPCNQKKRPYRKGGFKIATNNKDTIEKWWTDRPRALIGMPTGKASGIVVLDVDIRDGHDGENALLDLEEKYGKLPDTLMVITASGGWHLYFRNPEDADIRNSASKLGDGLDIRGNGGYVIVPPSKVGGKAYEWEGEAEALDMSLIAEMPQWLIELCEKKEPATPKITPVASNNDGQQPPPDAYAQRALEKALTAITTAPDGKRNDTLNREAFGLFGLVKAGRLDQQAVTDAVYRAARGAGLEDAEIKATLQSAFDSASVREDEADNAPDQVMVDGKIWQQPPESGTAIRVKFPDPKELPCYACYLNWWKDTTGHKMRPGVYYHDAVKNEQGEVTGGTAEYICSPLVIAAKTMDITGTNYGRLLKYLVGGRWKTWNMPMGILAGDGTDLRRELLRDGVTISPKKRMKLGEYLQSMEPKASVQAALELGWHGKAFVLPDRVYGADNIFFQSETPIMAEYGIAGTLAKWQQDIAAKAPGNPPLMLAICAAFAGPLLHLLHLEGGGLHLMGASSCGKTTALQAAASVWGGPFLKRTWRGTANGLEAAAAEANDLVLILDEIGECAPKEAGRVVYALGNGTGKARANQRGFARKVRRWRTLLLSSGEKTLDSVLMEAGERVTAGQDIRLLSIPADGFSHGAFDQCHDHETARHLADAIKEATATNYGHAGRAWLEWLTANHGTYDLSAALAKHTAGFDVSTGQEARAARVFALTAMAGEMATHAGVVPWVKGEAAKGAQIMWNRWIAHRGQGPSELRAVIESLQAFVSRYADRFEDLTEPGRVINDRAGWIKNGDYYFIPQVFNEAIGGTDPKIAKRLLYEAGLLIAPSIGRLSHRLSIGTKKVWTTHISGNLPSTDFSTENRGNRGNFVDAARVCAVPTTKRELGTVRTTTSDGSHGSHCENSTENRANPHNHGKVPTVPTVPIEKTGVAHEN